MVPVKTILLYEGHIKTFILGTFLMTLIYAKFCHETLDGAG